MLCTGPVQSANVFPETPALVNAVSLHRSAADAWDLKGLQHSADRFQKLSDSVGLEFAAAYWAAVAHFSMAQVRIYGTPDVKSEKIGKSHLAAGLKMCDKALSIHPNNGETLALKGTLIGMEVGLSLWKAPFKGPEIMDLMQSAEKAAPLNPRVQYHAGVSYLFTPGFLGGGYDKGIEYLKTSVKLFEQEKRRQRSATEPDWGHSTAWGFIGKAYEKKENFKEAWISYQNGLRVMPSDKICLSGLAELTKKGYIW
jgi:tetratricopeptide (TPR) repeat protein